MNFFNLKYSTNVTILHGIKTETTPYLLNMNHLTVHSKEVSDNHVKTITVLQKLIIKMT